MGQEILGVQRGVESVEAEMRAGVEDPDAARQVHPDPHGRVHGHRDADEAGPADDILRDRFDRGVDDRDVISFGLQASGGGGQAEGLMAQFIAGDEQDIIVTLHDETTGRRRLR